MPCATIASLNGQPTRGEREKGSAWSTRHACFSALRTLNNLARPRAMSNVDESTGSGNESRIYLILI